MDVASDLATRLSLPEWYTTPINMSVCWAGYITELAYLEPWMWWCMRVGPLVNPLTPGKCAYDRTKHGQACVRAYLEAPGWHPA